MSANVGLEYRLLGRVEVTRGGQPVAFRGARPRDLLVILLLNRNRTVPVRQLAGDLWGDTPPRSASNSIQVFVHTLRGLLGSRDANGDRPLHTRTGGYQLTTTLEQVDADRFTRLVDQARTDRADDELQRAWDRLDTALRLWRDTALIDVADRPFAQAEIARLEQRRLAAVEDKLRVGLDLGLHDQLCGELEAEVRAHPDREGFHRLLLLALYRSSRQAEALSAYQNARNILTNQLGRAPNAELEALQRAILAQDPALDLPQSRRITLAPAPPAGRPSTPQAAPSAPPPDAARPAGAAPTPPQPAAERREDQRKLVTVLVVGVAATGADPEDVRAWTAKVMEQVGGRVRHYRGAVQTSTTDRLLAVFGADRSREDDPERAVRAALEILAATSGASACDQSGLPLGVTVRAGVATGEALLTAPSAGAQPEDQPGSVLGDVVHLAVTLEQTAAPGTALVGSATQQATSRSISYRPVQPSSPLERASGLQLWQATAPRARTGAQIDDRAAAPLVERERELALLADVLSRFLRHREPQLVTLVSEPGLGKSRLVDELGRLVDQAPELVGWRVGRTYPYDQGALGALVEIVKAQAGVLDGDDVQTAQRKLHQAAEHLVGEDAAAQVTESLQWLLGAGSAEELPAWRQRLFDGVARFLAGVAEQRPLVVVFEDLQWADDVLLEFVEDLLDRAGSVPLLVVATGRPEFMDRRTSWGGGQRNAVTISLSPLTRDGVGRLLDALQAGGPLPGATRAALLTASGGNPLYVEEYVRMLREQDPRATLAGDVLPVPTSVQQVIAARIDTLPDEDKRLLQDAAVIGEHGWTGALAVVSGNELGEVRSGLERLQRRAFLRRVRAATVAGETEYAFRHTLIREVAYSQLLRAARADRHRRVAGWIESLSPDPGDRVEQLAHHYGRALELARAAGQPTETLVERARSVSRMAGDRATRIGSYATAARAYNEALALWPEADPDYPELLLWLGQALLLSAHTGEKILEQARQAAVAGGREDLAAEADTLLSLLELIRHDWAASEQSTRRSLDASAGVQAPVSAILSALGNRALHLLLTDRHAEAIATARQLADLARRHGMPGHEGNGLCLAGEVRVLAGELDGMAEARQGMALMEKHRFPLRVFARLGEARALWWYGDLEGCAAAVTAGLQESETAGAAIGHFFEGMQVSLDYAAGRWDAAVATAGQVLVVHPTNGRVQATCKIFRGSIALARGQVDAALADARAVQEAINVDDTRYRQVALALEGRCLLVAGRREEAATCLEDLLADQRRRPAESCATPDEAALLLDLGYPAAALPDGLPPTRWHQAVRALVSRDFRQAVEVLTAIGSEVDVAAARARLDVA